MKVRTFVIWLVLLVSVWVWIAFSAGAIGKIGAYHDKFDGALYYDTSERKLMEYRSPSVVTTEKLQPAAKTIDLQPALSVQ